jgi:hypothetical protein
MAFNDDILQKTEDDLAATEVISNTNTEGNQVLITIQAPVGLLERHAAISKSTSPSIRLMIDEFTHCS